MFFIKTCVAGFCLINITDIQRKHSPRRCAKRRMRGKRVHSASLLAPDEPGGPSAPTQLFFLNAFSPFFFWKRSKHTNNNKLSKLHWFFFFFLFRRRRWRWKLLIYTTTGKKPEFCLSNPRWPTRRGARLPRLTPSSSGCKFTNICNIQQVCFNSS